MTLHVVQRGNNRQRTFFSTADYSRYLSLIAVALPRYDSRLHAYVLMSNHVHLLMTSESASGISQVLQYVGSRYTTWINARHERSGTLWQSRFRSSPIGKDRYCLACYRYIELNPVRAGLVRRPEDYSWSSYAANALGRPSPLVTPHAVFTELASTDSERRSRYRALFDEALPEPTLRAIRSGVRKGVPTAAEAFTLRVEAALNRPIAKGRGRPSKSSGRS